MKIFGICLVKNESDIIAYSLLESLKWADKIFVYDNGSTDNTWDIVKELAKHNDAIIPFKSEAKPFRDGLRAEVFNAYRHLAKPGDWWCVRCDTDEFYVDNPKEFLPQISRLHHVVASMHFEYRLTIEDVTELTFDKPVEELIAQLRYYHYKQNCEIRFVKHRKRLKWPEGQGFGYPKHKGILAPQRVKVQHFQYRSPDQIQNRIEVRKMATEQGYQFFKRDVVSSWEEKLVPRNECILDDGTFKTGFVRDRNKVSFIKRSLLHILHGLGIFP
ncbi:MAG: glycosyltransferase family 2 protein [Saprospiraceae bacterium]|nr:glycosyltransferase family 2 protein [Saprospiraceae bacterium]